jgi:thiamine transport system substrate-binding protein
MNFPSLATGLFLASTLGAAAQTPVLTVYTYDSFISDWGPGPAIQAAFQAQCNCTLEFVGAGDGAALLARLLLEGPRTEADIVLGLDTNLTARASASGLFTPHGMTATFDLPITWDDPLFMPFDWGYFAFVHDVNLVPEPPTSFEALIASDLSVVIQDPRSSTPGLGLLMWVKSAYGDRAAEIWAGLAPRILTVTSGWSEAYGLFLDGEADMVLSYTTSPAYHLIAEEDASKAAAPFTEGHYMQVEVAGIVAGTEQLDLAQQFMAFMVSEGFQSVIPTTNWMYPAVTPVDGLPDGFETLLAPEITLLFSADDAANLRDAALDEWLTALSR